MGRGTPPRESGQPFMELTSLFLSSGLDMPDHELVSIAKLADGLGYNTLWTGESWGRDGFTVLTMLACNTQSLRLGTGIVTVFSRTPALIAQSIASLDQISGGRATLGLGTSGKIVIENWHGVPYQKPIQRTREYVQIIRQCLSGEPVNHQGEIFNLSRFRLGSTAVQPRIPIYLASLGPKNLELTGQMADGWLPIWVNRERLGDLKENVKQAAEQAGRDICQITAAPQIMCTVAENIQELAEAEQSIRAHMAYYIGGMGAYYYELFCRSGFEAEANIIRTAWADGRRAEAARSGRADTG